MQHTRMAGVQGPVVAMLLFSGRDIDAIREELGADIDVRTYNALIGAYSAAKQVRRRLRVVLHVTAPCPAPPPPPLSRKPGKPTPPLWCIPRRRLALCHNFPRHLW